MTFGWNWGLGLGLGIEDWNGGLGLGTGMGVVGLSNWLHFVPPVGGDNPLYLGI